MSSADFPRDYIVRIYRFEKDKPRSLVGLVEEVGKRGKRGFNSFDELWEILNFPPSCLSSSPERSGSVKSLKGKRH